MKLSKIIKLAFICGLGVFNSCLDEECINQRGEVVEGIPTTATLTFSSKNAPEIETKSAISEREEYRVDNLYVLVFKQQGSNWITEQIYDFSYDELQNKEEKGDGTHTVTKGNIILKDITSGYKRIYAIANADNPQMPISDATIREIENLSQLEALYTHMTEETVERGNGKLMMSGAFVENGSTSGIKGEATIKTDGGLLTQGTIQLERMDSRITFVVETEGDITFTPNEWRVINVPKTSYIYEKTMSGTTNDYSHDKLDPNSENDYFQTTYTNFNEPIQNEAGDFKGGKFTFYMLENRKRNILQPITDYQDRERQKKNTVSNATDNTNKVVENGDYLYAHKYATYVEMTGDFFQKYMEDGQEKERSARVKYIVHLGYVNNNAADFASKRNTAYTYKVKIAGVDNIRLEVTTADQDNPTEKQPGAEGDIVESKQFLYADAHYETRLITFNKSRISKEASFRIKTPFDEDGRGDDATDYKWVWFVQNPKESKTTSITKTYNFYYDKKTHWGFGSKNGYPANEVETGGKKYEQDGKEGYLLTNNITAQKISWKESYYDKRTTVQIVESTTTSGYLYKTDYSPFPKEVAKRIHIKDLIAELKKAAFSETEIPASETSIFDSNGNAVFTVFIDEYYYEQKPEGATCTWKDFVNKPNREMHILCDTEFSQDQQSSLTTSNFLISQRSIKTFYNPENTELRTAWGVETIREGDRLSKGNMSMPSGTSKSNTNGRYNMYNYMGLDSSPLWSKFIDASTNTLVSDYNKAANACLQRNRDLDGDEEITANEVRWYLPALNQLTGMWMGRDGLPMEAYLFKGNSANVTTSNRQQYHFLSSDDDMLWAEEGSATGNTDGTSIFDYRCIRNLGAYYNDTPSKGNEPQDYVTYDATTRIFNLNYMNDKSLRENKSSSELTVANELNQVNRPYKRFKVAKNLTSGSITKAEIYNNSKTSPCATYKDDTEDQSAIGSWRMPNQRELSLILAYSNLDNGAKSNVMSRTISSLSYKQNDKYVYTIDTEDNDGTKGIITLSGNSGKVRCVKDID